MFITLIKVVNYTFWKKVIQYSMYKTCIKIYITITQDLVLKQRFTNTIILYE